MCAWYKVQQMNNKTREQKQMYPTQGKIRHHNWQSDTISLRQIETLRVYGGRKLSKLSQHILGKRVSFSRREYI